MGQTRTLHTKFNIPGSPCLSSLEYTKIVTGHIVCILTQIIVIHVALQWYQTQLDESDRKFPGDYWVPLLLSYRFISVPFPVYSVELRLWVHNEPVCTYVRYAFTLPTIVSRPRFLLLAATVRVSFQHWLAYARVIPIFARFSGVRRGVIGE